MNRSAHGASSGKGTLRTARRAQWDGTSRVSVRRNSPGPASTNAIVPLPLVDRADRTPLGAHTHRTPYGRCRTAHGRARTPARHAARAGSHAAAAQHGPLARAPTADAQEGTTAQWRRRQSGRARATQYARIPQRAAASAHMRASWLMRAGRRLPAPALRRAAPPRPASACGVEGLIARGCGCGGPGVVSGVCASPGAGRYGLRVRDGEATSRTDARRTRSERAADVPCMSWLALWGQIARPRPNRHELGHYGRVGGDHPNCHRTRASFGDSCGGRVRGTLETALVHEWHAQRLADTPRAGLAAVVLVPVGYIEMRTKHRRDRMANSVAARTPVPSSRDKFPLVFWE